MAAIADVQASQAAAEAAYTTLSTDVATLLTAFAASQDGTALDAVKAGFDSLTTNMNTLSAQVVAANPPPAA